MRGRHNRYPCVAPKLFEPKWLRWGMKKMSTWTCWCWHLSMEAASLKTSMSAGNMLRFIIAENNDNGFQNVEAHVGDVMYIAEETSSCSRQYFINFFFTEGSWTSTSDFTPCSQFRNTSLDLPLRNNTTDTLAHIACIPKRDGVETLSPCQRWVPCNNSVMVPSTS